jgi:hypothetical protein
MFITYAVKTPMKAYSKSLFVCHCEEVDRPTKQSERTHNIEVDIKYRFRLLRLSDEASESLAMTSSMGILIIYRSSADPLGPTADF